VLRVLLAIPAAPLRRRLELLFRQQGLDPASLGAGQPLWERLTHEDYDLVVVAAPILPAQPEGLIRSIRSLPERPEVVVLRPREDAEERAQLLAAGCMAVLWQGLPDAALARTFQALVDRRGEDDGNRLAKNRPEVRSTLDDFVYTSPAMQQFMLMARRVAPTTSTLLILGETGVGKEWLARAIHAGGPRAPKPFVAVNCGALPESLLETELFGHEEGAFTGATRSRKGYFELAHQGTVLLDEIGDMPTHVQVKLLRVIDQGELVRVGGERPVRIDVRVMAATNRDLAAEIKAGRFRLDLYYRLAVVTLNLPPLRERKEDIPALVDNYLKHFSAVLRKPVTSITDRAMAAMVGYAWPGNVRELINVIERALLLSHGTEVDLSDLPSGLVDHGPGADGPDGATIGRGGTLPVLMDQSFAEARLQLLRRFEREYLVATLRATGGRIGESARRAGMDTRSLYGLMRRHGLSKEAFKERS